MPTFEIASANRAAKLGHRSIIDPLILPDRLPHAALLLGALALVGCGVSFVEVRPTEPLAGGAGAVRVDVQRMLITDDVLGDGVGEDTALAVELSIANSGDAPYSLSAAAITCLLEIDRTHPSETLSLPSAGGGAGAFPGGVPEEGSLLAPVVVAPGQRGALWVLFRGYRYPSSDIARRVVLRLPGARGDVVEIALADPGRGLLRWNVEPPRSGWGIGLDNTSLFGNTLSAMVVSTRISRVSRAWKLLWDVGLQSSVIIESQGTLTSVTSSFAASGLAAHVGAPFLRWGTPLDPRQIGAYAGGGAQLLTEIQHMRLPTSDMPPHYYGVVTVDGGLELDIGALRFAASPFPLVAAGRPLPRWSLRLGYTHWFVAGAGADGYTSTLQLAW